MGDKPYNPTNPLCWLYLGLPHWFKLLESNIHDQHEPPNKKLAISRSQGISFVQVSTLDPDPPWGTLIKLQALATHFIHQVWHILPSPSPQTFVDVGNGPLGLNPLDIGVIHWDTSKDGICLFEALVLH